MNEALTIERVGLEAGPLSQWLYSGLAETGLPVICVETRVNAGVKMHRRAGVKVHHG
jgi:transposase